MGYALWMQESHDIKSAHTQVRERLLPDDVFALKDNPPTLSEAVPLCLEMTYMLPVTCRFSPGVS